MSDKTWLDITHPAYAEMAPHWVFCRQSYDGGPGYHKPNLFKFRLEDKEDFEERVKRAARYNFTRQVVDLINGHLFKVQPYVKLDDAPEHIKRFFERCTTDGDTIDNFRREMAKWASVYGRAFVVVDVPSDGGEAPVSEQERRDRGLEPYAYIVPPEDVLDLAWDGSQAKGSLRWIKIRERYRDDSDPTRPGEPKERFRLWFSGGWSLWEKQKDDKGQEHAVKVGEGTVPFREVPIVLIEHEDGDAYTSPGLVDDTVYLDRDVFNLMSELSETLSQQTFGQLVMPSDGFPPDLKPEQLGQYLAVGKRRVMVYDAEAKHPPMYIQPDASQGGLILDTIERRIEQIYRSANLGSEVGTKTGQSSATSGVTMAYTFAKLEALLSSKAAEQEEAEKAMLRIVDLWCGGKGDLPADLVSFPREFDVTTLQQDLTDALSVEAVLGGASPTAVAELRKQVVSKSLERLEEKQIAVINQEIEAYAAVERMEPHEEEEQEAEGMTDGGLA